jgi:hypothetical protein
MHGHPNTRSGTALDDLQDRIYARQRELIARWNALKNVEGPEAAAQRQRIEHKLEQLDEHLRQGLENVLDKLSQWLSS